MKSMKRLGLLLLFAGLSACGGGGGGGTASLTVADLAGTWSGTSEYYDGVKEIVITNLNVVIDSSGLMQISQNGATMGTGTLSHTNGTQYTYTLANGTTGRFLVDSSMMHAGFLDESGSFGVMQKGSSIGVTYTMDDIVGNWSGYTVVLNSQGDVTNSGQSSATVDTSYSVSGTDYDGISFLGNFTGYSSVHGLYDGTWTKDGSGGYLTTYLSPDKQFAATYACESSYLPSTAPDLSYCTYRMWNRN